MHDYICTNAGEAMENNEEEDATPKVDPQDRARDLDELLEWHCLITRQPPMVANHPEWRKELWVKFREETDSMRNHLKWNAFIEYFGAHLIRQEGLDGGNWRTRLHEITAPCSGEDAVVSSGRTLRSLALCHIHKSLKYTTRVAYQLYHVNYRVQSPILDLLPLPSPIIGELAELERNCHRHRKTCGLRSFIGEVQKYRIIKCEHDSEDGGLVRSEPCERPECQLYEILREKGAWKDRYSRHAFNLFWLVEEFASHFGLAVARWLMVNQKTVKGLQTLTFSE